MVHRRTHRDRAVVPRPTRRGFGATTPVGEDYLLITAEPPATFQNDVAGGSATVRLMSMAGQPIERAGVTITLRTTPDIFISPQSAVTDATGAATFTDITLSGPVGTYRLLFNATGFLYADSPGHTLAASGPSAANTTASVPTGLEDHQTLIFIQLRDTAGNDILTNPGGVTITVQGTGTNPFPEAAAVYATNGQWMFGYTPANDGTDTLTIKLNGTAIGGSPYTAVVEPYTPPTDNFTPGQSLRLGMAGVNDMALLGTGPYVSGGQWVRPVPAGHPQWRACVGELPTNSANLIAALALLDQYDMIFFHYVSSGATWYGGNTTAGYNEAQWRARVDRFLATPTGLLTVEAAAAYASALARRRVILYGPDEPHHQDIWHGTFWPYFVKRQQQYFKNAQHWPNSLTAARTEPWNISDGWTITASPNNGYPTNPVNNMQPDGVQSINLPKQGETRNGITYTNGYFDKLDYTWATFLGKQWGRYPNMTPATWYKLAYDLNKLYGYGTVFAVNWVNYREQACFLYHDDPNNDVAGTDISVKIGGHAADLQTGSQADRGKAMLCSAVSPITQWFTIPETFKACVQAAAATAYADVPAFIPWTHPGTSIMEARITAHGKSPEYVAAFEDGLRSANARSSVFNWRPRK
jgi:hypothetical protein